MYNVCILKSHHIILFAYKQGRYNIIMTNVFSIGCNTSYSYCNSFMTIYYILYYAAPINKNYNDKPTKTCVSVFCAYIIII